MPQTLHGPQSTAGSAWKSPSTRWSWQGCILRFFTVLRPRSPEHHLGALASKIEAHTHTQYTHMCACPQGLLHRMLEEIDTQNHPNTPSITSGRPANVSRRFKGDKPQLFFPQSPMTGSGGDLTGPEIQLHRQQVPRASARAEWATAPFKASACPLPIAMRGH